MLSGLAACTQKEAHNHGHEGHNHGTEAHRHDHDEDAIHLSKKQAKAAQLETEEVIPGDFTECIRVSGQVITAQGDEVALTARSSGIVTFLRDHLTEGAEVRQGEALARISAADMEGGDAIAQHQAQLEAARKAYDRAKALMQDSLISVREYQQILQEYELARLTSNGQQGVKGTSAVSPLTGYIRNILVKQGEYVSAGTVLATLTKSCNLQLRAELPEKYFKYLHKIRSANFEMSYGGEIHSLDSLHGHLVSKGQAASEASAYIPVTFEFVNDGCIVPGSFADIWLLTDTRPNVISIPTQALTEEQGIYYAYLLLEEEHGMLEFEKREVQPGLSNGLRTEIRTGLKVGESVVTQGVTQVKLAGARSAIPEAHSHSH